MKEVFSAFQSEVFTPVMTLVAPGGIAMAPCIAGYLLRHRDDWKFLQRHHLEVWAIIFLASIVVGLMLENFGTLMETEVFDSRLQNDGEYEHSATHESDWYSYLRLAFRVEPVGHRYLRFERNGCIAFAAASIGCWYLPLTWWSRGLWAVILAAVAVHLLFEAKRSHRALSELRHELLKGFTIIGDGASVVSRDSTLAKSSAK
jgi:MFS family permease